MADTSMIYSVILGQTSAPLDHNSLVQAITNLNAGLNATGPMLSSYGGDNDAQDAIWTGIRTACYRDELTGFLYPAASDLWTGSDTWTGIDYWAPGWASVYGYQTNGIDLGAEYLVAGSFSIAGSFVSQPTLVAQYSPDGISWFTWPTSQAGLILTLLPATVRYFRFQWAVTQSGGSPNYTSGFSYSLVGPQLSEEDTVDVPVSGVSVTYDRQYPQAPGVIATAAYGASQDVRVRVTNETKTGCHIDLVLSDAPGTAINGRVSYRTVLPK